MPLRSGWRVMYAVGALPPPILAAGVIIAMPESPRWLAMRGRHADALAVLVRTSDGPEPEEADLRLEEIIKHAAVVDAPPGGGAWTELLVRPSATTRRVLVCVIGLQFFQEASGIEAIVLYTPLLFKQAGMSSTNTALLATVAVGVVKTLSIVAAALLADRLGRRPLLLASAGGVAAAMLSLAAALQFGGGLRLRGRRDGLRRRGSSLGTSVGRVTCGLVSMTFISLADWITMPGCFVVYAGVAAVACVFVYVRVPETRGRGLEDMEVLFAK
ncbi:hypothetical protein PR202_gb13466 [Eleusine coracana subsp. coracana]|uniref:Major facilitator superfamily (MFS) profile domain-containing protein n=1 Tax=Eleusine coracana subsp. coracana TaxID=191504 RepID=A0AAV5EQI3_ELECO|nr:hypothetical protein PR202_gb13466 [Eleusine coracana subsp. coracana]